MPPNQFTKKAFREAFDAISKAPLQGSVMYMSQDEYDDIVPVPCEKCGGSRSRKRPHTQEECDLHRCWEIMEQ